MRFQKIEVRPGPAPGPSRLGGLPMLGEADEWPRDPESGVPLLLLLTLENSFFSQCGDANWTLPNDHCLSVFVSFDSTSRKCVRRLAVHEESQLKNLSNGAAQVIVHQKSTAVRPAPSDLPSVIAECALSVGPVENEDIDPEMPDRGTIFSKAGGLPGWAQDAIDIPGHGHALQLSEADFWKYSQLHAGILGGGTGFLFLPKLLTPGEAGKFFIQFS